MTTVSVEIRCGCCGRILPTERLVELGSTPDVYICDRCALWAARRSSRLPVVRLDPRDLIRWLRRRTGMPSTPFAKAIPILPSADLNRTVEFYRTLGMVDIKRYEGYLLMQAGPVELHFSSIGGMPTPGEAFIHVRDAGMLWKQLKSQGASGLGPVEDQPYGLREFVVVDPDGNKIRVGSPIQRD
jgi:catechol 2,3-dioxygenase-like lactoylglutathione lyase family enzyme